MRLDISRWTGEGEFSQLLIERLKQMADVAACHVEDAPATRSEADYNFISNEFFIEFAVDRQVHAERRWGIVPTTRTEVVKRLTLPGLEALLAALPEIGAPDYADEGMLQYLRAERIVPPYQTRGYKLIELVRLYEAGTPRRP